MLEQKYATLDSVRFSEKNRLRCETHFDVLKHGPLYWAVAIAEEAGEIAGAIKKLQRGFNEREKKKTQKAYQDFIFKQSEAGQYIPDHETWWKEKKLASIRSEFADLFTYLDLGATQIGFDLPKAIIEKFNIVSTDMNLTENFKLKTND